MRSLFNRGQKIRQRKNTYLGDLCGLERSPVGAGTGPVGAGTGPARVGTGPARVGTGGREKNYWETV
jgi:hypothetical protein